MRKPRTLHYVLSTHWDREWYLPFQGFRHRLVRLMDQILDRLEDGTLIGPFTGDGQAILIEDYLEIRPEREAELRRRVGEGAMVFGPWFVLPDEFLVSGESLIRNLELGRKLVRRFGGTPSNAGFLCDMFGHNSQMPQIMAGFGITGAFVWRGVDARIGGRFIWEGADGTRLPTYRFGRNGYCDYTYEVRHSNNPEAKFDPPKARADLIAFLKKELERTAPDGPGLVLDGGDHLCPDFEHYGMIKSIIENSSNEFRLIHGTFDAFLAELAACPAASLTTLVGELREPARWPVSEDNQYLIAGVGSSRVLLKQENAACEALLCRWAEPFAALASLTLGSEYSDQMLQIAWKWLLQNHPHDSICGCSTDQVHQDMLYRFSQCRQLAECVASESLVNLAASAPGSLGEREIRLAVFNPLSVARDEVLEFDVEIPVGWPEFGEFFGYESKPAFRIFDADGGEVVYQRLAVRRNIVRPRLRDTKYPQAFRFNVVRVAARLAIPAMGFASLKVVGPSSSEGTEGVLPTRHLAVRGLRTAHASMENEFLSVEIQAGGILILTDKTTGQTYGNLNVFQDDADIGDGWNHGPTTNRRDVLSGAGQAQIEIVCDTPLMTTFVVRQTLTLPESFDVRDHRRAESRVPLIIESRISLRAGARVLDIETQISNTADDHRLRVMFSTDVTAETYLADAPFDVVERRIALREDNHDYREMEVEMKPQQTWAAVFDGTRGLAVVTAGGQLESGVLDRPDRPLALTLFRATSRTVLTNGEPDGQLHGQPLRFRYRLVPFAGEPDRTALFRHGQDLAGGVRTVQLSASELHDHRALLTNSINAASGLLSLAGPAVLTSARLVGGALEVRMFNPCDISVETLAVLGCDLSVTGFLPVDFESAGKAAPAPLVENSLSIQLSGKHIITVRFVGSGSIRARARVHNVAKASGR